MRFLGFLDGGFCVAGALPVGASFPPGYYWRRACHGPPLCGPFFGLFWLFVGFGTFGLLGLLPLSLPIWPPWPPCLGLAGLGFFGLRACLGLLLFCLGLCGKAYQKMKN